MKNYLTVFMTALIMVIWLPSVQAAKVCIEHEGKYILVEDHSMNEHLTQHGDTVVDAINCVDACVDHKGKILALSKEALQEHVDHGDSEVNVAECL